MDYSGQEATALYKYQWDLIHNPQRVWFAWLEDEEEGKVIARRSPNDQNPYIAMKVRGDTIFYHSGDIIYIPKNEKIRLYCIKKHMIYTTTNDTFWVQWKFDTIQWKFNGATVNNNSIVIDANNLNSNQIYQLTVYIPVQSKDFQIGDKIYTPKSDTIAYNWFSPQ